MSQILWDEGSDEFDDSSKWNMVFALHGWWQGFAFSLFFVGLPQCFLINRTDNPLFFQIPLCLPLYLSTTGINTKAFTKGENN